MRCVGEGVGLDGSQRGLVMVRRPPACGDRAKAHSQRCAVQQGSTCPRRERADALRERGGRMPKEVVGLHVQGNGG